MKPHIALTLEEFRAAYAKLGEMIATLEAWDGSFPATDIPARMTEPSPLRFASRARRPKSARPAAEVGAPVKRTYKKRQKSSDLLGPQGIEKQKRPTLIDVMRKVIGTLRGPFSCVDLQAQIILLHPEMEKRLAATSVNLLDMAARGELKREGAGRTAKYTALKSNSATDREKRYQDFRSTVPAPPPEE